MKDFDAILPPVEDVFPRGRIYMLLLCRTRPGIPLLTALSYPKAVDLFRGLRKTPMICSQELICDFF